MYVLYRVSFRIMLRIVTYHDTPYIEILYIILNAVKSNFGWQ